METELCLPKTEHPVWFLKVDSFLLHGTSLWTPVSASSAEPQGVQVGFWIRVATFNGTLWFNWEFSALWLEDVKVALSERHKGPMYGVRLMRGRIRTVPGMYQPGSPSGLELTATRDMENKLPHTHTHTHSKPATQVKHRASSGNTHYGSWAHSAGSSTLYPFLTLKPVPKNAKREAIKVTQRYPTIN